MLEGIRKYSISWFNVPCEGVPTLLQTAGAAPGYLMNLVSFSDRDRYGKQMYSVRWRLRDTTPGFPRLVLRFLIRTLQNIV